MFKNQIIPLVLTVVIFFVLMAALYGEVLILNFFTHSDIVKQIHFTDVLVGLTIYLKTAVDFAIFIGNLMAEYRGVKNRIMIEIGTAVGNAVGTMAVLAVWSFFKEIEWLLALMVFIASLVLLRMAQDGLEHAQEGQPARGTHAYTFLSVIKGLQKGLLAVNAIFEPVLKRIIPHTSMKAKGAKTLWGVFAMSFTIPFILGLDDFAGYVPLFDIVKVYGFAIGVLAGHMVLNALLFISPGKTIAIVKNSIISFIGSLAFIALAVWGLIEVYKLLFLH